MLKLKYQQSILYYGRFLSSVNSNEPEPENRINHSHEKSGIYFDYPFDLKLQIFLQKDIQKLSIVKRVCPVVMST